VTEAAAELGYPVVVEAPDRSGERSVALAADHDALAAAAAVALAESRGEYCLVEELVGGRMVTVNAFSLAGRFVPLTVTDREQAPPPAFGVPLVHLWPAELDPAGVGAAVETAAAAARALGIDRGPTTTQVLLGEAGPLLAKLSARVGGGHERGALSRGARRRRERARRRRSARRGGASVRAGTDAPGRRRVRPLSRRASRGAP